MAEWQPIETAPKDGTPVLVYVPDLRFKDMYEAIPPIVAAISNGRDWLCQLREPGTDWVGPDETAVTTIEPISIHPTRWMPMPALPAGQDE